jgi:cytidyltransferase-like protein
MTCKKNSKKVVFLLTALLKSCHVGHHNVFMAALQYGNRLFVGVLSDESVAAYKRKPVMTTDERASVVATCKGVYKVPKLLCVLIFWVVLNFLIQGY